MEMVKQTHWHIKSHFTVLMLFLFYMYFSQVPKTFAHIARFKYMEQIQLWSLQLCLQFLSTESEPHSQHL